MLFNSAECDLEPFFKRTYEKEINQEAKTYSVQLGTVVNSDLVDLKKKVSFENCNLLSFVFLKRMTEGYGRGVEGLFCFDIGDCLGKEVDNRSERKKE